MAKSGTHGKGVPDAPGKTVAGRPLPGLEQRIELARPVERDKVVAAADMAAADEDLRHGGAPPGAPRGLLAFGRAMRRVDLAEARALGGEQAHGAGAVRAPGLGI